VNATIIKDMVGVNRLQTKYCIIGVQHSIVRFMPPGYTCCMYCITSLTKLSKIILVTSDNKIYLYPLCGYDLYRIPIGFQWRYTNRIYGHAILVPVPYGIVLVPRDIVPPNNSLVCHVPIPKWTFRCQTTNSSILTID
jgi:hypothetical protein